MELKRGSLCQDKYIISCNDGLCTQQRRWHAERNVAATNPCLTRPMGVHSGWREPRTAHNDAKFVAIRTGPLTNRTSPHELPTSFDTLWCLVQKGVSGRRDKGLANPRVLISPPARPSPQPASTGTRLSLSQPSREEQKNKAVLTRCTYALVTHGG